MMRWSQVGTQQWFRLFGAGQTVLASVRLQYGYGYEVQIVGAVPAVRYWDTLESAQRYAENNVRQLQKTA